MRFTGQKFELGQIVSTPGASNAMTGSESFVFLGRHARGDWGEVCAAEARENSFSVENGFRILSAYTTFKGEKIWIITEADRSVTTFLLPEEY